MLGAARTAQLAGWWNNDTGIVATGGTITDITVGGVPYRVHTFTSNGTFTVTSVGNRAGQSVAQEFLCGGGGGGAGSGGGGGGGGGAVFSGELGAQNFALTVGSHTITVGAGGTSQNYGSTSNISPPFINSSATGGAPGASYSGGPVAGGNSIGGGAGGGSPGGGAGGTGTLGVGGNGGAGTASNTSSVSGAGGGGGTGGTGAPYDGENANQGVKAGDGGDGVEWSFSGTPTYYGGGGGGGAITITAGTGGQGGGGNGTTSGNGGNGTANTGGGGGGGGQFGGGVVGGTGGSGLVMIRYPLN